MAFRVTGPQLLFVSHSACIFFSSGFRIFLTTIYVTNRQSFVSLSFSVYC